MESHYPKIGRKTSPGWTTRVNCIVCLPKGTQLDLNQSMKLKIISCKSSRHVRQSCELKYNNHSHHQSLVDLKGT